ncbi:ATP-binding cassette domain-containing protein [Jatrophihabitans cynanchi]|uniref:ATP-binding cassette domain-containing protein n=1 Tax=Jatrophihabitans cynanchi TaxID=2944128 RepID=A0ABY7K4F2_9ACTN|nr:ATP-binding cassette domain-containing protein [Jatrophihabitans sp. SB3-54]WAX58427.1 ATP-binding cassette domain-containing protein [Jatrophihabitans sp. SB3-54]
MHDLLPYLIIGLTSGSVYALIALGLVLTYKVSNIFNLAHGAIATVSAYIFYALHVQHHVSWPLAALASVVGAGLVFGLIMERIAKALEGADFTMRIVATVGILLLITNTCQLAFGSFPLPVEPFLPVNVVNIFGVAVTVDRIIIVAVALIATVALYVFFRNSRLGKSIRAVVDNAELLDLSGTSPTRVRRVAWIIGCTFATLSGPLLVDTLGSVDVGTLTALVIQAFAAAALGSFSSLPLTYVGGLFIGLATSVSTKYIHTSDQIVSAIPSAMPFIILFVLMLVMPKARLVVRSMMKRKLHVRWSLPPRFQIGTGIATLTLLFTVPLWAGYHLGDWTAMLSYVVLFLSVGLLVRTSGQVALCHATFAAIGAVAFSKLAHEAGIPWLVALVLAGLVVVPIGAIIAIPAIRLSGTFLALATLGFGLLVQSVFYQSSWMFGLDGFGLAMPKPHLSWLALDTDTGFYYVVLAVACVTALVVVTLVRSRLGRLLRAMADSPQALATAGVSVNLTRLLVFCISAFFAAIAGALYGMYIVAPTGQSFDAFTSATYVTLLAIMSGIAPWYALNGAIALTIVSSYWHPTGMSNYLQILFGLSAISVAILPPQGLPAGVRAKIDRWGGANPEAPKARQVTAPKRDIRRGRRISPGRLEVQDLTVRFGGLTAVRNFDLEAHTGTITGLIGPNGAGKTTIFNVCSGLIRPTGGRVTFAGADISRLSPAARARRGIGRTYQHIELWDSMTVRQNVTLGHEGALAGSNIVRQLVPMRGDRNAAVSAADDAIALCGLTELADAVVASLSTGKRRLIELARCLAGDFTLLLLDEPSSGLDAFETEAFGHVLRQVVEERGIGILLVEHDMRLVMDVCEYIYVLDFGEEIFRGTPHEVAASTVVRSAYLGSEELDVATRAVHLA